MCIAILNKSGLISRQALKNSWDNNNHGAGVGYVENGETKAAYFSTSFRALYKFYKTLRETNKAPILLHFRIATSGYSADMLHPHTITEGKLILIHNGVIRGLGSNKVSDTREFANALSQLKPNGVAFFNNQGIKTLIETAIGTSNKLVFLDKLGKYFIFNESAGHWDNTGANWYSNESYLSRQDFKYYGNVKVYNTTTPTTTTKATSPSIGYNRALYASDKHAAEVLKFEAEEMKRRKDKRFEYWPYID